MKIEPKIRKTYVPSGQYEVSGKKPEILEAILGTCVAVALSDREANVGGMMHILLAAPFDRNNVWEPLKYAETGLPSLSRPCVRPGRERKD
jgi:chemotaxis receptor (MCP) glutamine deamidase CheD